MAHPVKVTRRTLAASAVDRWREVYGEDGRGYGDDKAEILKGLRALGPSPSPSSVDEVIGNGSWTAVPECDGCGKEHPRSVVRVGAEPDYDSPTAHLCGSCAKRAAALFA